MSKKKTTKKVDPLEVPAFLRRKSDPAVTNKVLRQDSHKEWIMPDISKKETSMAKKNGSIQVECSDPALPVEVNLTIDGGGMETKRFDNINEFLAWYDPKSHELEGSIADAAVTMVAVREKVRAKKPEPEEEKVTSRGAVIVPEARPKKPRGVGFIRHHCKVGKDTFTSVYQAFVGLSLSLPAHTKFRAELKKTKDGKLTYEEKGKKYPFELVEIK
jgi:hypothetical protein